MQERFDLSNETSTVSLREYGDILRRRRAIILQTFVIVLVAGVLITLFQPPTYQASARLLVEPPSYLINSVNSDPLADLFRLNQQYSPSTQVELLRSSKIRQDASKLMTNGKALTNYSVQVVPETSIIELTAEGDDALASAETANNVLKAYQSYVRTGDFGKLQEAKHEAEKQKEVWEKKKAEQEKELLVYQNKYKISEVTSEIEAQQKVVGELTVQYQKQLNEITLLQSRMGEIRTKMSSEIKKTRPELPDKSADAAIQAIDSEVAKKEAALSAIATDVDTENPQYIALKKELDRLHTYQQELYKSFAKRNERFNAVFQGLEAQLLSLQIDQAGMQGAADATRASLLKAQQRLALFPQFTSKVNELTQALVFDSEQIKYFTNKMQDINLRLQTKPEAMRLIEEAVQPQSPIRPKKAQNILFAGLLGVFLGLCLALLQELLDDRINSPEEAERVLRLPSLGLVPLVEEEGLRLIRDISTFSPLMESYRSLRTNINFAAVGSAMRSIVVTSSVPAEGKSTTAANLAMAMALDGKRVIIVDADLRRPSLHKLFRTDSSPGLTDVLVGTHDVEDVMRPTGVDNVQIISAGSPPPNPAELLGSAKMVEQIAKLEQMADVVLFDSPPTLAVADSVVLAARTNGVVIVVGFGETKKANTKKAIDLLQRANAKVLGTVLNRMEGPSAGYYYGKYYVPASLDASATRVDKVANETRASIEAADDTTLGQGRS